MQQAWMSEPKSWTQPSRTTGRKKGWEERRASAAITFKSGSGLRYAGLFLVSNNGVFGEDSKWCRPARISHWNTFEITDTGSQGQLYSWYS